MKTDNAPNSKDYKALERKIALSMIFLKVERGLRAHWPTLVVSLVLIAMLLLANAAVGMTPLFWVSLGLGAGGVALVYSRRKGRYALPTREDAVARLDGAFRHGPVLAVKDDLPKGSNAQTRALWELHQKRSLQAVRSAQPHSPHVRLSKQDRWATRLIAILFLGLTLAFGQSAFTTIGEEATQGVGAGPVALGPSFEGWIEPPDYTGEPTYYLSATSARDLEVPLGSEVLLRVYGSADRSRLSETVSDTGAALVAENQGFAEANFVIAQAGTIEVNIPRELDETWTIAISPDTRPTIQLDGELERSVDGTMRIPFVAEDDFGVFEGTALLTLDLDRVERDFGFAKDPENTEALIFDLPVGLARDPREVVDTLTENLARHPWANLPINIELRVLDGAGQTGIALIEDQDLPGKRFFDPLAAALIDQRAELLWNRENAERSAMVLRAVTWKPEDLFADQKAFLMVRTAIRILERDFETLPDDAHAEVEDLLWRAAVLIEEGDLNDAAERLRRAQERLSEAMRRGASDEEIAELMQELREATRDYMNALAQNAEPMDQQQAGQQGQTMSPDQLQQMMDRIQELMEEGRMAEAQELLDQLMRLMENMRIVQGGEGGEGQPQQGEELQDTLREQQDLADETFEQLQEEFNRNRQALQDGQQGQQQQGDQQGGQQQGQQPGQGQQQGEGQQPDQQLGQGQPGQPGQGQNQQQFGQGQGQGNERQPGTGGNGDLPSADELARRQQALRDMLDEQGDTMGNLPGADALEDAERSMGDAADALRDGDLRGALDNQADAMDALRRGISEMNEAQRQQQQGQQQGGNPGGFGDQVGQGDERDPLGRSRGNGGAFDDSTNSALEEQRRFFRELDAEIRRRAGDQSRTEEERDYLRRLLDRF